MRTVNDFNGLEISGRKQLKSSWVKNNFAGGKNFTRAILTSEKRFL